MDRMEILRLAFTGSKNPKEAMELAHQMADFVGNKPKTIIIEKLKLVKDEPKSRNRKHWTADEALRLKNLVLARASIEHMAFTLKRSKDAIRKAVEREMWNWPNLQIENDGQPDEAQEWADFDRDC